MKAIKKRVYRFGGKTAEGDGKMRELLGGKGANLAEMNLLGMPVPAGFTITTECCTEYYRLGGGYTPELRAEVAAALEATEKIMGKKFGDEKDPLLVSCRSGARSSMPGMMDTILNIGLCSKTIPGLIAKTQNPRFVYDAYRRLIMMYSDVVMEKAEGIEPADGQGIRQQGDLAAILSTLSEGEVLFIDEIHRLPKAVEEILYSAMEDYQLDIVIGKGPGAQNVRLPLPKFTLIGATTRLGSLAAPLRDRFGVQCRLEFYQPEQLCIIVNKSAEKLSVQVTPEGALEIACRSRGTPRVANRLLKRVRDFAQVLEQNVIDRKLADEALSRLEVDRYGLDQNDRRILNTIVKTFGGGPVGVDTIAAAVSEEAGTIEDVVEPYLMQLGLLQRTPRGRVATRETYRYLGIPCPEDLTGKSKIEQPSLL